MEIALKPVAKIMWNGKNVTADLEPFLSSVTYTDNEEGAAASLQASKNKFDAPEPGKAAASSQGIMLKGKAASNSPVNT